jgi:hypothetical protein
MWTGENQIRRGWWDVVGVAQAGARKEAFGKLRKAASGSSGWH